MRKFVTSNLIHSFLSFSDEQVVEKVTSIRISLDADNAEIVSTIKSIKDLELGRLKNKDIAKVEELEDENQVSNDISILNHFCTDLDDVLLEDDFTLVTNKKRSSSYRKKKGKKF